MSHVGKKKKSILNVHKTNQPTVNQAAMLLDNVSLYHALKW